jgi:hypothetical protein
VIRARRSTPATLVALVILAVCVVVVVAVLQQLAGHRPFIPFAELSSWGQRLHLNDTPVIIAGCVAAALGLILLATVVIPGKPTVLPLAVGTDDTTTAGVRRAGLTKALRASAGDLDGIAHVTVKVRKRRVTARLRTEDTDIEAATDSATTALDRRLAETDLARPVRLRIRVTRVRRRNTP